MSVVRDLRRRAGLTQRQLAELAATSQPAIAAYEAGRKSPSLRTLARMSRSAGLEAFVDFIPPLTREDRRSLALHEAIADVLREEPGPTLRRARSTLARMARRNPGAAPLLAEWRRLLRGPVEDILEVLRDPRPSARELRHVTPFAGLLSAGKRTAIIKRFASMEAARG